MRRGKAAAQRAGDGWGADVRNWCRRATDKALNSPTGQERLKHMSSSLEETISRRTHAHPIGWLLSRQTFWVFVAFAGACLMLTLATTTFATERNLFNVTRNFAFVGIIAILVGVDVVHTVRGISHRHDDKEG